MGDVGDRIGRQTGWRPHCPQTARTGPRHLHERTDSQRHQLGAAGPHGAGYGVDRAPRRERRCSGHARLATRCAPSKFPPDHRQNASSTSRAYVSTPNVSHVGYMNTV